MATGTNIKTYFDGAWHDGDRMVINAADHGAWLGTTVFDGARLFDGLSPDLEKHCARINRSAAALMITPTVSTQDMVDMIREGLAYETVSHYGDNGFPTLAGQLLHAAEEAGEPPFQPPYIWRRENRKERDGE